MTLFKLTIVAALVTYCICESPTTLHHGNNNNTENCTYVNPIGRCVDDIALPVCIILVFAILLILGLMSPVFAKLCRLRNTCQHYTTAKDANVDKVYKQLRRKWTAHEEERGTHLVNCELPISFFLDERKQNRTKNLMADIQLYNEQCNKLFATKEYSGREVPRTTDFTVHFADECAAIENFAAKIEQMKKDLPRRQICA